MKTDVIFKKYTDFCIYQPNEIVQATINGAGPAKRGEWVRDTLFYKFTVTDAANVHDFLYSKYGLKEVNRKQADGLFLSMMLKKLKKQNKKSKVLNKPLIYMYYFAVRMFGGFFWEKTKID